MDRKGNSKIAGVAMRLIREYARLVLFTAGILVGVQVPNFIDQYAKRISAHHLEAQENFRGYQQTANTYFEGDVAELMEYYQSTGDPVFIDDAKNIRSIHNRIETYALELKAMDTGLAKRIFHVAFMSNDGVIAETMDEYTYTVPLNGEAIVCGLSVGFLSAVFFEALLVGCLSLGGMLVHTGRRGKAV